MYIHYTDENFKIYVIQNSQRQGNEFVIYFFAQVRILI